MFTLLQNSLYRGLLYRVLSVFQILIMINVFLFSLKTGGVAALYLLSPFDIVPEAAFGIFGLLDDLVIVALFLIYSSILYRNFVVQDDT